ncbi:MAG: phenylalanine--tRNA ligase subunit beta [Candidatus Lokiarchaeota archaeon]|nr:phenylalanine--tRNA ligase subunit beta [Candidatus Lokiarchaeota archaeon]
MPTLDLKIERLERLVGKSLIISDLEYDLQWISLDLEDINEEERTIKVEYNPNRPDFSSPEGISRALKGYYELELGLPKFELSEGTIVMNVDEKVKDVRPYIVCAVIKNIDLDDDEVATLMNIQEQLHWAVGRDRKKVAIGVHDLDKLKPPFRYTAVPPKEVSFVPLHGDGDPMDLEEILKYHEKGIQYAHILDGMENFPLLLDNDDQVISFPPVINGILTTVTDDTKNLFIEMTGTEEKSVNLALNILTAMLADTGAQLEIVKIVYEGKQEITTPNLDPIKWDVDIKYINSYLGLQLSATEMIGCFRKVRMDAQKSKKKGILEVFVPAFRGDIIHPVDFTEECAMGYGYFNLPLTIKEGCMGQYHPIQSLANKIRTIMVGAGYLEVLNFILANSEKHYDFMNQKYEEKSLVQITNPVSKEYNTLRTKILPKLMETLLFNRSEEKPIRIFEVGDVIVLDSKEETGARRDLHLSAVSYHEDANFTEMRSTLDFLITALGKFGDLNVEPVDDSTYIKGRCGKILFKKVKIGEIGEIHPEVIENYKLEFPVVAFEIDLQKLL